MARSINADRLNPTDAALWEIRRDPELRTTIVALALLERRPDWIALTANVERAVRRIPRLRQRVADGPLGIGRPRWVDAEVDLSFHLRRVDVPEPKNLRAVLDICGPIAAEEFDSARPLWEMLLIEGMHNDQAALVLKVSHALTDGVGGVELLRVLDDCEHGDSADDDSADDDSADDDSADDDGDSAMSEMDRTVDPPERVPESDAGGSLLNAATVPLQLSRTLVKSSVHPRQSVSAALGLAGSALRQLAPTGAPLSPLMVDRGLGRWVGCLSTSLPRLQKAAHRAGGTINDALVTIALGALADYHVEHGVAAEELRVTMPVSFRKRDDAAASNQWTPSRFVAPLDQTAHPFDLLHSYHGILRSASHEPAIGISHYLAQGVQQLPAGMTAGIVAGMVKGSDLVITNIPGPTEPIRFGGVPVTKIVPFSPTGGAALNVGLLSYAGQGNIGLTIDTAAVAHPEQLVRCVETRLADFVRRRRRPQADTHGPDPRTERAEGNKSRIVPKVERLSALDTSFLRMESETTPMHMGSLMVLKGGTLLRPSGDLDIESIRAHFAARVNRTSRLLQRVQDVPLELGRPVWVPTPEFEVEAHVRQAELPAPGGRTELLQLCEELQMQLLDRSRPLFEVWFITGLNPDEFGPGAVGFVEKVHHALLDGMSGVELLTAFFDPSPTPLEHVDQMAPSGQLRSAGGPSNWSLVANAATEQLQEPAKLARLGVRALLSPRQTAAQLTTVGLAITDLIGPSSSAAPSLNQPVGSHRELLPLTLSLERVHETASLLGGTINDVLLAAVALAFRRLFVSRNEALPSPFHALVPVSTREAGLALDTGNHVSALVVDLPLSESDPQVAFALVRQHMRRRKLHHHADGTEILLEASDHLPAPAVDLVSRLVEDQELVNVVVTNLPGPPSAMYLGGAEITAMVPIVPLGAKLTASIAVVSYKDDLVVALHVDSDACPDSGVLIHGIETGFEQLANAAGLS